MSDSPHHPAWFVVLLSLCCCWTVCSPRPHHPTVPGTQPTQIHLSYTGSPTSMVVTWSTLNNTASMVEYGQGDFSLRNSGISTLFVDGGKKHNAQYIHRVVMTGLKPGFRYIYHVGSEESWSAIYSFTAVQDDTNWSPRFAVYGDLGYENAQSVARLTKEVQRGMYDAILHVGDFAYDMNDKDGEVGDAFMSLIQPIAAYLPYMTCVGNHETAYNFSHYINRFSMPGSHGKDMFYSFNIGPAHIISINTEVWYLDEEGSKDKVIRQREWLHKELEAANTPEQRQKQPWIILMGHRPMYCSNVAKDCIMDESFVRQGIPKQGMPGIEDLLYKYGVDLTIWAHEHSYERLWPVYDKMVMNGSMSQPYTNPQAPVHIITGSAGCKERLTPFVPNPKPWSAFRLDDYGYIRMTILNSTHLYLEQVSDDQDGVVVDSMQLIKLKHDSYSTRSYSGSRRDL
ncbi:PREDICTED: acid phosphatase type 7-like [Branchiostoma belcheri]|uniref:Purple acid phosphatase n=1 Tax=Branchiostoma belcheri TaxID=7741 RepID=A0A6P4YDS6_BRABE|nr:PREDICTED: acid phosphatase type 7-like [Branchiostoma belcheri]